MAFHTDDPFLRFRRREFLKHLIFEAISQVPSHQLVADTSYTWIISVGEADGHRNLAWFAFDTGNLATQLYPVHPLLSRIF